VLGEPVFLGAPSLAHTQTTAEIQIGVKMLSKRVTRVALQTLARQQPAAARRLLHSSRMMLAPYDDGVSHLRETPINLVSFGCSFGLHGP
jgi:hypothetical protein